MPAQFLQCPNCHSVIYNPFYMADTSGMNQVFFEGNKVGCGVCGASIPIPDFAYSDGIEHILSGPAFTPQVLTAFSTLVVKARTEKYTPEKFTEEAEKIAPEAGGLARFAPKTADELAKYLTILLAAIIGLLTQVNKKESSASARPTQTTINNYYSSPAPTSIPKKTVEAPTKRGSNYTPPKKKRKKK